MNNQGIIILCSSERAVAQAVRDLPRGLSLAFVRSASKFCADQDWIELERKVLSESGFKLTDVTELNRQSQQTLLKADGVFIAGGNTFFLLSELRRSGFDKFLIEMHASGKMIIGESAGAVVLGPTIEPIRFIDQPEMAPDLSDFSGLKLIDFFPAVHFGREEYVEQYGSICQAAFALKIPLLALRDADSASISQGKIELRKG